MKTANRPPRMPAPLASRAVCVWNRNIFSRGIGPIRLAMAGATRSGSAGVVKPWSRSGDEAMPHRTGPAASTGCAVLGGIRRP
jgi:hypothetical protein